MNTFLVVVLDVYPEAASVGEQRGLTPLHLVVSRETAFVPSETTATIINLLLAAHPTCLKSR